MLNIKKFLKAIKIIPKASTEIDSQGEIEVLNTDGKLRYHNGTSASPIVTESHSATLSNKSIDADSNTITNIENADIKAAAGIVESKLSLDYSTSSLNTAITDHLNDTTDVHDASAISNVPSGNLSATDVQAALNELQTDIDTRATVTQLNDHLNDTTDAHDASAISNVPSGNLAATDVQSALNELQTDIDNITLSGTTAANVGTGTGVYKEKIGNELKFKTLLAGSNAEISSGTNEITIIGKIDALQSKGDIVSHDGTTYKRIPTGDDGQVLRVNSSTDSGLEWSDEESAINYDASLIDGKIIPHYQWDNVASEGGINNPSADLPGNSTNSAINPAQTLVAMTFETFPYLSVYQRTDTLLTKIADANFSEFPAGAAYGCSWNNDGTILAVAHATSPFITLYSVSGTTFTKLSDPASIPTGQGNSVEFSANGQFMAVAHNTSPYVTIYEITAGPTFTKLTNPATLPTGNGNGVGWSADYAYLSVAHTTSPYVTIYSRSGSTFTKLTNPATLPTGQGNAVEFSPSGQFMSVAHTTTPYVTIYEITAGPTFTKLTNPATLPPSQGNGVSWSSDNNYLAVAHVSSPYVTIYSRSGTVFTKLTNPSVLPTGNGNEVMFTSDTNLLVVNHVTFPYVTVYEKTDDIFAKIANPAVLPPNDAYACEYAPNGDFLAVGHSSSPYVTIYQKSGSTYTKLANPATLPTGYVHGICWSSDSQFLVCAHQTSPYVTIYQRSGTTFTKLANPATLPTGNAKMCSFSPDTNYLAIAHDNTPYITVYERSGTTFTKLANPATLPAGSGATANYGALDVSWNNDNTLLAVAHHLYPYISIYQRSGSILTKLTNPTVLPNAKSWSVRFSPNGQYLIAGDASGSGASPYYKFYTVSGTTFTYVAGAINLPPTSLVYEFSWSGDSNYVLAASSSSPFHIPYKRTGSLLKKISSESVSAGVGYSCGWNTFDNNTYALTASASPFIYIFDKSGFGFATVSEQKTTPTVKLTNPASLPVSTGYDVMWSPNNKILGVAQNNNGVNGEFRTYLRNGNVLTFVSQGGNISGRSVAWSGDSQYMFVGLAAAPFIKHYLVDSAGTATVQTAPATLPTGIVNDIAVSPNSQYVAATHNTSPYVTIYERAGATLTKLTNPTTLPTGNGQAAAWSPDGSILAVAHTTAPYVTMYSVENGVFTLMAALDGLPVVNATSIQFSPDNMLLMISHDAAPYLSIYSHDGEGGFSKIETPDIIPNGVIRDIYFHPTNKHVSFSSSLSPYIFTYEINGTTFTKLANLTTLPTGDSNGVAVSSDGRYVAVAHATSPFITVYRTSKLRDLVRGVAKFIYEFFVE